MNFNIAVRSISSISRSSAIRSTFSRSIPTSSLPRLHSRPGPAAVSAVLQTISSNFSQPQTSCFNLKNAVKNFPPQFATFSTNTEPTADSNSTGSGASTGQSGAVEGGDEEDSTSVIKQKSTSNGTGSEGEKDKKIVDLTEKVETLMRAVADMDNSRKIQERELVNTRNFAVQKFAKKMLDVADNLQRALDSTSGEDTNGKSTEADQSSFVTLREGVDLTNKELRKVLQSEGIVEFGNVGEDFDPNKHNALFNMKGEAGKDSSTKLKVGQVIKSGWMMKDRVLRPAQVGTTSEISS